MIRVLAESAGAAVTREQLIDEVWDENWWGSTKTLDVHINSIRRKLGEQAGSTEPDHHDPRRRLPPRTRAPERMRRRVLLAVLLTTTLAVVAFFVPASVAIRNAQRRGELLELQREASIVANRLANLEVNDGQELQAILDAHHPLALYSTDGQLLIGTGPDVRPTGSSGWRWRATSPRVTSTATSSPPCRSAPHRRTRRSSCGSRSRTPRARGATTDRWRCWRGRRW